MSNPSRSPSTIQARNASSPLRKSTDPRISQSPKLSSPSDSSNKIFRSRQFFSEKENEERDPATAAASITKGRSPLMPSSSPKKNFMAPTISASSKAASPFQRKRVLTERNESISSPQIKEPATTPLELGSLIEPEITSQNHRLQSVNHPPYDPKVNYLSPRPRFLHYKPKPEGVLIVNEHDFFGTDSDSTSPDKSSSSSEGSDAAISVQTEDEIELQEIRVRSIKVQLKVKHVLLVLLIGCMICIPLLDSPMIASNSNPSVGFHVRLLEVSSKFNGWLAKGFLYFYDAGDRSFPGKIDTFPLANLTCLMDGNGDINELVIGENERSEEQIEFGIGEEEEEEEEEEGVEEEEEKEIEEDDDFGNASEMGTSAFISEMRGEEETQVDMFEESDLGKQIISESELAENKEVIMAENPKPKLKEPESDNMFDEQINVSGKAIQIVVPIAVLLSLVVPIVAIFFAKKKQNNRVPVSDSVCGKTFKLAQDEFSSSSFEVGTNGGFYANTPRERETRRESDASSGSYGSYVSFEKISSKKGHGEVEEMITPVRRSSRLRDRPISSYRTISS